MVTPEELHDLLVAAELTFASESTVGPSDAQSLLAQALDSREWRDDDGRLTGLALAYGHGEGGCEVDRSVPGLLSEAVGWLVSAGVRSAQCLETDAVMLAALREAGFHPSYGAYDLERPGTPTGSEPAFGVWTDASLAAIHDCIYSVWADGEGHVVRSFDEWEHLFTRDLDPALQVVVASSEVVDAVAIVRTEPDGLGWVAQLAVRREHQREGLGRRVLLEAVRRLQEAGMHGVGLSVNAPNTKALGLYESLGFEKVSAWITSKR